VIGFRDFNPLYCIRVNYFWHAARNWDLCHIFPAF